MESQSADPYHRSAGRDEQQVRRVRDVVVNELYAPQSDRCELRLSVRAVKPSAVRQIRADRRDREQYVEEFQEEIHRSSFFLLRTLNAALTRVQIPGFFSAVTIAAPLQSVLVADAGAG